VGAPRACGPIAAAVGAVTIPWSYAKKSVGPFIIGMITSVLPDLLYANWRCDDKYRLFREHCEKVQASLGSRSS
jgi:hypothetical protein